MEHLLYSATSGDSKKILDEIKDHDQDIGNFLHMSLNKRHTMYIPPKAKITNGLFKLFTMLKRR